MSDVKHVEKEYSLEDWKLEAIRRFGENLKNWTFVCPSCGNIQSMGDFEELVNNKIDDVDPNMAYYNCIGRHDTRIEIVGKMCGKIKPCNYTSGGLVNINPVAVKIPDGRIIYVFDFALEV